MVLELEDHSTNEIPVYKVAKSSPERNNLIPSRPRRNVGAPKFYGERLYVDVRGEQATKPADSTFRFSDKNVSENISENERESRVKICFTAKSVSHPNLLNSQSVSQPSPIISQVPTETRSEPRTFTEEEAQELLNSLPPSVVEKSDDSEIDSELLRKCEKFLNYFQPASKN